jgi:hypothetical protein
LSFNALAIRPRSASRARSTRWPALGTKRVKPAVAGRRAHVAGGAHALPQQPGFVIETVGVGVPVRTLQAHRQAPAFARADRQGVIRAAVPRQGELRRNAGAFSQDGFDRELEADALAEIVRQLVDRADDLDIAPFVRLVQLPGQHGVGKAGGPAEAEQRTGDGGKWRLARFEEHCKGDQRAPENAPRVR